MNFHFQLFLFDQFHGMIYIILWRMFSIMPSKTKEGIRMTLKRTITLLLAVLLVFCAAAALAYEEPATEEVEIVFDVTDYISGLSELDLSPYRGKVMALFFYVADNEECQASLPIWKTIYDTFDPYTVEIILVHAWEGESHEESDALKERFHLEGMNIFEDIDCILCDALGVHQYPNTLFLDAFGTPASGYNGQLSLTTISDFLVSLGAAKLDNPQTAVAP